LNDLSFCNPILDHHDAGQDLVSDFCPEFRREVYYCGVCYNVLINSRSRLGVDEVKHLLSNRMCPGCSSSSLENLQYTEVFSSVDVVEDSLLLSDDVSGVGCDSNARVVFESAAVLRGLTARLRCVDRFVGGLKPSWFVFFWGGGFADRLVERYCVNALIQSSQGRLGGAGKNAVFFDAGMSFDPYSVASLARVWRFSAAEALDRVVVARAFTCYELWSLISDLPRLLDQYNARLVVISGVFRLFAAVDNVKQSEAERILDFVGRRVIDVCRERNVLCIATAGGGGGARHPVVSEKLTPYVDVSVAFRMRNRRVYGSLLKHPSRSPLGFWVESSENRGKRLTLDSFQFQQKEVTPVG
jgi:hypothetical protein